MKSYIFIYLFFICTGLYAQNDTVQAKKDFISGEKLYKSGDYNAALEKFKSASDKFLKASKWKAYLSSQQMIAETYANEGNMDLAQGVAEEAIKFLQEKFKVKTVEQADLFNTLGFIYLNKGRDDIALDKFQEALNIYKLLLPEASPKTALCYINLGLLYYSRGNNELALEYEKKALNIRQKVFGENTEPVADIYNNLGLVYTENNTEEGLNHYDKALEIYKKTYNEDHPKVANVYNNIAFIFLAKKDYKNALQNLNQVLTIRKKLYTENHPNIAFVYSSIGRVYEEQGEFSQAMDYQQKALKIYKANYGEKHFQVAATFNFIGNIYRKQKKFNDALNNYQQALCANHPSFDNKNIYTNPSVQKYYKAMVMLNSLLNKAHSLEEKYSEKTLKRKELELSLITLKTSDTLINLIRKVSINKTDKLALGVIASEVYEEGIRISILLSDISLHKNEYLNQAFYFSEKSKAAVLLESISDAQAKKFANIPDELLLKERQLKADIAFYEQKLTDAADSKVENEYRNKIFTLNRNYDEFIKKLENDFPQYYNLKFNINVTDVKKLQSTLDDKSALLSYFTADINKRIYVFYISKKQFKVIDSEKADDFERNISGLKNSIKADAKEIFQNTSYALFKQLFAKKPEKNIINLIIIPDGKLGIVPFEALLTKKSDKAYQLLPYLIRKYAISYDYSATLFYQKNIKNDISSTENNMLALAPVTFNNEMADLPATKDEVEQIANLVKLKSGKTEVVLNQKATKEFIENGKLKQYNLLHFATHGVVNEENPELSQIFFSKDSKSSNISSLYAGDIYNLEINADLVTLSCCETGLGKILKGEGIIGLTRAWIFAGGKNILVSLWSVNDNSTSSLMKEFYSVFLQNNSSKNFSKALQSAKIKMISEGNYAKPYNWAPFILIGK